MVNVLQNIFFKSHSDLKQHEFFFLANYPYISWNIQNKY